MQGFTSWIRETVVGLGPWGLFVLAFADSSFVPLPQAVDALVVAGAIATPSTAYLGASLAVAGSLIGSLLLYEIARAGGRLIERRVSSRILSRLRQPIKDYGALVLLPPTLLPVPLPMAPFVIAAGLFQMSIYRFAVVILVGRSIRYLGEAYLALRYGDQTIEFLRENTVFSIGIAVLLVGCFYTIHRWSSARLR